MKTAKKIKKDLKNWNGDAAAYALSEPIDGHSFVIVSAVDSAFASETFIFPAAKNGDIIDYGELKGSVKEFTSHEEVLGNLGFKIVK